MCSLRDNIKAFIERQPTNFLGTESNRDVNVFVIPTKKGTFKVKHISNHECPTYLKERKKTHDSGWFKSCDFAHSEAQRLKSFARLHMAE